MSNKFNTLSLLPKVVYDAIFLKNFRGLRPPNPRKGRRPQTPAERGCAPTPLPKLTRFARKQPPRSKILATCLHGRLTNQKYSNYVFKKYSIYKSGFLKQQIIRHSSFLTIKAWHKIIFDGLVKHNTVRIKGGGGGSP